MVLHCVCAYSRAESDVTPSREGGRLVQQPCCFRCPVSLASKSAESVSDGADKFTGLCYVLADTAK